MPETSQHENAEERFKTKAFEVAFKEYLWIEEQIDHFDDRSLKIKALSITLSAEGIVIALRAP